MPPRTATDGRKQIRWRPERASPSADPPASSGLAIFLEGLSRVAGEITSHGAFWMLSNLNACKTYVVEHSEGAGGHIKGSPALWTRRAL